MTPASPGLGAARERFWAAAGAAREVRDTIAASWTRSRRWEIPPDGVAPTYTAEPDLETPLARAAGVVLPSVQESLNGSPVSLILTDRDGVVLDRRSDDSGLVRYLDRVQLAPGFSYAEQDVGTNGIGTALESGQPTEVWGQEHYTGVLDTLGCAGVPVRHPVSGQTVGLLDMTCWSSDAGPLLLAMAKSTASLIEQELLRDSGRRELDLFGEYLRACRRSTAIVLAVNADVVMLNDNARHLLTPEDQAMLIAVTGEAAERGKQTSMIVELPSGGRARLLCSPIVSGGGPAGGVARVRLERGVEQPLGGRNALAHPLPGVVGSGGLWVLACEEIRNHYLHREWVTIGGEAGVGKFAVASALHRLYHPTRPFRVVDLAQPYGEDELLSVVRAELEQLDGTLVLRHVHAVRGTRRDALANLLHQYRARRGDGWVVATGAGSLGRDALLSCFPASVELPPLRHHADDIAQIVPVLLARLATGRDLTVSGQAMQLLMRTPWPGNVAELTDTLRTVVQHRRSGVIEAADLPANCHTISGRLLNPLESMERDAVVAALRAFGGNRSKAAASLSMSRATIYRKIQQYRIDVPS
ncbi:sigma-54-dependent Fis family transcriptional regulator [Cryptosporangium phraense]|uniref:Fis family transcriptional regulator n=1 Tax=Cryptosporangium phraense TaxID=2593070 RepID=A0A545B045_9ACTN|nr:helix-turn-helix domain-containing protein [Cryptosporangium phraense]TQS46950.1 Fis family transcriptional regulator [Cryptosporangium phraense]